MFRTTAEAVASDAHADLSFRRPTGWMPFPGCGDDCSISFVLLGDEEAGPCVFLSWAAANTDFPLSYPHTHATDNWRMSVLGQCRMGPEIYKEGQFRLQEGWKYYPSDDVCQGPEGGWQFLVMADRRGMRVRGATPDLEVESQRENAGLRAVCEELGCRGDVFTDAETSGPSAIASNIVPPAPPKLRMGKLNGSFADSHLWPEVSAATRASATLFGDIDRGPVLVVADTRANECAMPASRFDTEVMRLVVEGSCEVDGQRYEAGDMRVQYAGKDSGPVQALENGLKEVLLFGDRRFITAGTETGTWPNNLPGLIAELQQAVKSRH